MELIEVADGILFARRRGDGFGSANNAAVIEDDGITVVDACTVPSHARELAEALEPIGIPIRRLVYTSPHVDHVGGSTAYPLAAVYGTGEASALLEQPPNTEAYRNLAPELADEFTDLATRPVTHTVREAAWISTRIVAAPVAGQTAENLVAQIPDAGVVLAGAMAAFGVIPAAWAGDPSGWADALDTVLGWGSTIVPGHGPLGAEAEVRELQAYLRAVAAATDRPMADGPWSAWGNQRFHQANLERARQLGQGDLGPPPTILRLMGIDGSDHLR